MRYMLVKTMQGENTLERDVTPSIETYKGIQGYYHAVKDKIKEYNHKYGWTTSLYKETDKGREFIFNIP